MEYLITFLEGIISFISPCMLPMLPLYLSYFAGAREGGDGAEDMPTGKQDRLPRALPGAMAFVTGFTLVFCGMGLLAGTAGRLLMRYQIAVNLVTGGIVILFGLAYMEVIHIPLLRGMQMHREITGVLSAFVFGIIFSVSLTPCVGAFLGSALMLASASGGSIKGVVLLLLYSMGLGIPFVASAVLIGQLQNTFAFIKRHYRVINLICGGFLILVGIMMATGQLNRLLAWIAI